LVMKMPSFPKLSRRAWAILVVIILILSAIPTLGLVLFTTTHSFYCLTCHRNQNPPERWMPSRVHPASVTCVDCHSKPGELIPRNYSAGDDLVNERCLRCHSTIPRREQTDLQNVRIVKISHKGHAGKGALCTDCHFNIEHDALSPRTNRPQMETCYSCHQAHPRTQACDKCHPVNLVYTKK